MMKQFKEMKKQMKKMKGKNMKVPKGFRFPGGMLPKL